MREAEIQGIGRLRLLLCDIVWLEVLTCDVIDATVSEKR
jgi:hypothetical protein